MTFTADPGHLDGLRWVHETPVLQALGFRFTVRVMEAVLGTHLDSILGQLHVDTVAEHRYSLVDHGGGASPRFTLYLDGDQVGEPSTEPAALQYLLWHVNQEVIDRSDQYVLIHAAAVARGGAGVVLPAPMDSGKTTMAAGLVRAGLSYLTDEAVAIEPDSARIVPYPKALSLDRGSWAVLADLEPRLAPAAAAYAGGRWQVAPDAIRPGAVARSCAARLVVAPHYERGSRTRLVAMGRAEAVRVLAQNSFNLARHGGRGVAALARLVSTCDCYRLAVGDLDEACGLITGALERDS